MIEIGFHKITITCDRCGRKRQFDFTEGDGVAVAYSAIRRLGWKIRIGGGMMNTNIYVLVA